ncbi:MAG TPA: PAS domain S-box protein, partial [Verrucomicrobiae bacterium]|nr:PAS domain S-box protein [Verrucomicrobiae bacterium]
MTPSFLVSWIFHHFHGPGLKRNWVWILGWGLLLTALPAAAANQAPASETKTVLVLAQGNGRQPNLIEFMSGFQQALATNFPGTVDVYIENLDVQHFDSPEYRREIIEWLRAKYRGRKLDAIVAANETTADLTFKVRAELWPRLPLVAVDYGRSPMADLAAQTNLTVINAHTEVERTLQAALWLCPDARQIAYVSSGDNGYADLYRRDLQRVEAFTTNRYHVIKLIGLTLAETKYRLTQLPPHTIVFYDGIWIDASGQFFTTREALAKISPTSAAPIFSFSDTFIGQGIVGGCCHVYPLLGAEVAGQVAAAIRAGNASAVPDLNSASGRLIFDWQQLHRFGLDKKVLPPGSEVRFQPPTLWKTYHHIWIVGMAVVAVQTGLIALLLLQRLRMRKAEEELSSSQLMLRTVLDTIPHHVIWKARNGLILGCNRAVIKECGNIIGKTDFETSAARYAEQYHADDLAVMEKDQPRLNFEEPQTRKDGSLGWYRTSKVPLHDRDGRVIGILGTYDDITELKRAEEAVRESERRLRTLAEASFEGICVSENGRILDVNDQFAAMFDYERNELIGREIYTLVVPEWRPAVAERIRLGEEKRFEHQCLRKDGSVFECEAQARTVSQGDREVRVTALRDLTERKGLEAQLRQSQKMQAFGQLAAGVAHDFNNILTVIQGNVSLLQMGTLTAEEQVSANAEIFRAAQRAANLTRQLLTFSRRQPMQPADLDLNEVVANVTKMLRRLIGEDIALETRYAPGGAPIHADPGMLEQILMNLAVNARDAMPKGGRLTVETAPITLNDTTRFTKHTARPGDFVRLSISDTGCGVAPDNLPHLFEPFFTTKDVGKGTGLGLATVFGIVEQHQGWIEVESQLNQGTTFHVYFPRLARKLVNGDPPITPSRAPGGTETILLVEDEIALRRLMQRVLERHGYQIHAAGSGLQALEIWRE